MNEINTKIDLNELYQKEIFSFINKNKEIESLKKTLIEDYQQDQAKKLELVKNKIEVRKLNNISGLENNPTAQNLNSKINVQRSYFSWIFRSRIYLSTSEKINEMLLPTSQKIRRYLMTEVSKFKAEEFETYSVLDCQNRSFYLIPQWRSFHMIRESSIARDILKQGRGKGEEASFDSGFYSDLENLIDTQNMLLCPKDHARLRKPLEHLFSSHSLNSLFTSSIEMLTDLFASKALELGEKDYCGDVLVPIESLIGLANEYVFQYLLTEVLGIKEEGLTKQDQDRIFAAIQSKEAKTILQEWIKEKITNKQYKPEKALDCLQKADLTDEERLDSATLLIAAGLHTTTTLIQFAVSHLETSEAFRKKLHEEWKTSTQQESFNDYDSFREAFKKFVQNSELLESYYLELIRLYPIIPYIQRVANEEMELEGHFIKEGDGIVIDVKNCNIQVTPGDNPHAFNPDRFSTLTEDERGKANTDLLTFSLGRFACIGKQLAKRQIKMIIAINAILWKEVRKRYGLITPSESNNSKLKTPSYNGFSIHPSSSSSFSCYFNETLMDLLKSRNQLK